MPLMAMPSRLGSFSGKNDVLSIDAARRVWDTYPADVHFFRQPALPKFGLTEFKLKILPTQSKTFNRRAAIAFY
jgi:hypothetical protein